MKKAAPPPSPPQPPQLHPPQTQTPQTTTALRQRIVALEQAAQGVTHSQTPQQEASRKQGILLQNLGFRVASDLLAGIIVGALIGWGIDHLFATKPWGFIGFFILGSCAGIMNVMRLLKPHSNSPQ